MLKILKVLKRIPSEYSVLVVFVVAILIFALDKNRLKKKGYIKESKMVDIMGYSYIVVGVLLSISLIFI